MKTATQNFAIAGVPMPNQCEHFWVRQADSASDFTQCRKCGKLQPKVNSMKPDELIDLFSPVRAAYGIPKGVPIIEELDRRFERMEALLETAWKALDGWSGDIELSRAEADALCDTWEKLGDWKGWPKEPPQNETEA